MTCINRAISFFKTMLFHQYLKKKAIFLIKTTFDEGSVCPIKLR
jgi:hypothetical protein